MTETRTDEAIRAEARSWLLRQTLDGVVLSVNPEFQQWYRASERHAQAYEEAVRTWSDAATLQDLRFLVESPPPESVKPQWRVRALAASVALAMLIGLVSWVARRPQIHETRIGEVRDVVLPDGSVLTLGGRSVVAVSMADDRREAELRAGEIFLAVQSDRRRPFYVLAGETEVRVVGTQFEVRRGATQVEIGVLEGIVEVSRAERAPSLFPAEESSAGAQVLHAGQQLTADASGEPGAPQPSGAMRPGGWRKGRRVYVDTPLREIVADANRYSRQQIRLADPHLGDLKVSVSFRSDNQQQLLEGLQVALPLRIERSQPDLIVMRARHGEAER